MSRRPRRNHSAAFKAKVALEALEEGSVVVGAWGSWVWAWRTEKSVSMPNLSSLARRAPVRDHAETLSGISLKRCPPSPETLSGID